MTARMHHYVPQLYLKNFVQHANKPKLTVFDRVTGKRFDTSPSNVAVERDFNRIEAEGVAPDTLENMYAAFEGEASKAVANIVAARSIAVKDDFDWVLNLMAMLAGRNPRWRRSMMDFHRQIAHLTMGATVSSREIYDSQISKAVRDGDVDDTNSVGYEAAKAFFDSGKFTIEVSPQRMIPYELQSIDVILPRLAARKWHLLRAPAKQTGFITSDHPVCLTWARLPSGRFRPPGHGVAGTQVVFTLSNELALVGSFEHGGRTLDADEQLIARVNSTVIAYAERQVYARSAEFVYRWEGESKLRPGRELLNDRRFQNQKCV